MSDTRIHFCTWAESADSPELGFDVSCFSAKLRPALRYQRLSYDEVDADYGLIRTRTGLTFIPILITPGDETWQDSTDVYDRLEARHRIAKRGFNLVLATD